MTACPQLFLDSKQAKRFDGRHPWVREHSIIEPTASIDPGQTVELLHPKGSWIGRGIYNPHSRIRVRLYQWDRSKQLDEAWICEQLESSVALRAQWMQANQQLDAVRLVNSEGDGLSGLVVERYGDYLVVQISALAMLAWSDSVVRWLVGNQEPKGIYLRIEAQAAAQEGIESREEWVYGDSPPGPIPITENGVLLQVEVTTGQKTGYYLDQRANRLRAAKWVAGGPLLDVCCYQGGFTLAACRWGKPSSVTAVDSSNRALQQAQANAEANGCPEIDFVQSDCFDYLEHLVSESQRFQTVILDPPRMAGNRSQMSAALRAYHRLNLSAVRLLEPGGILVTCSCSGRVKKSDFVGVISSVAKRLRRRIQVIESLGADFDHPIDASCPESEYLKCLICRVE